MSHSRYWMERAIQDAKGEAGLAEYDSTLTVVARNRAIEARKPA
jgi:hypothetical protein